VFVEILEVVLGAGGGQQGFILAHQVRQIGGFGFAVGEQQGLVHSGELPGDGLIEPDKLTVDQHEAVFGVVHGVQDLFRRQAHVDGVDHRADHRDGEHAFQIAMAVPIHHRHRVTGLHSGLGQHIGQARDAFDQGGVGVTQFVTVDDFPGLLVTGAGHQQALDQQWVLVRTFGGRDNTGLQHTNPFYDCTVLA